MLYKNFFRTINTKAQQTQITQSPFNGELPLIWLFKGRFQKFKNPFNGRWNVNIFCLSRFLLRQTIMTLQQKIAQSPLNEASVFSEVLVNQQPPSKLVLTRAFSGRFPKFKNSVKALYSANIGIGHANVLLTSCGCS